MDQSSGIELPGDPRQAVSAAYEAMRTASAQFGEMHPTTAEALSDLAAAHHANGDPAHALAAATRAVDIFRALGQVTPGHVSALFNLGVILAAIGDYYTAVGMLKCALAYERREPSLRTAPDRDVISAGIAHSLAGA
jgi:Flp pilus assembly protein TadD